MFEIILAWFAGILAFMSPCVLPLVPAYISYMAGRVSNTVEAQVKMGADGTAVLKQAGSRFAMGLHGTAFVLGFTTVFVLLTLPFSLLNYAFEGALMRVGGILIVFFGLHFMGVIPAAFAWLRRNPHLLASPLTTLAVGLLLTAGLLWGFTGTLSVWMLESEFTWALIFGGFLAALVWLALFLGDAFTRPSAFWHKAINTIDQAFYADTRRQMIAEGDKGLWGSFSMGLVFAAGWTPCIGPVLGAAMGLAVNDGALLDATLRITAFSLGLGVPFILTALMFDSAQGQIRRLNKHLPKVKVVTGILLIFVGTMMLTGQMKALSVQVNNSFGDVTIRIEECFERGFRGHIGWGDFPTCVGDNVPLSVLEYQHSGREITSGEIRSILRNYPAYDLTAVLSQERIDAAIADIPRYGNPANAPLTTGDGGGED
ncbi:MAG: cytochrome c biogenesis protein CcdA [Anaerolineaceae bacterium]|nr:MAG: cytochrome c biogenesis protein CcdA [Anaerolineaceae bacterium]